MFLCFVNYFISIFIFINKPNKIIFSLTLIEICFSNFFASIYFSQWIQMKFFGFYFLKFCKNKYLQKLVPLRYSCMLLWVQKLFRTIFLSKQITLKLLVACFSKHLVYLVQVWFL